MFLFDLVFSLSVLLDLLFLLEHADRRYDAPVGFIGKQIEDLAEELVPLRETPKDSFR